MSNKKPMTVRELIAELQKLPEQAQNAQVVTEGCDCYGDCGEVQFIEAERAVTLWRTQP